MKIEMAPWAKAYTVDMKDMYTELTLEKIENKPSGPSHSKMNDYRDLFKQNQDLESVKSSKGNKLSKIPTPSKTVKKRMLTGQKPDSNKNIKTKNKEKREGDRVLLKGEPGFGKTTLSRKITWDWAMRLFTKFTVVFFLWLKLVRPGDVIENIIIKQTPPLHGMNVTPNKLKKILDTFGHRCLIILDGLDELPTKSKQQIVKTIMGENMFCCNIFLTFRPHNVAELENYFHTIARLQGFTAMHADSLVDKIVTEKKQRREVRKFIRKHQFLHDSPCTCPILLVFICILAQNKELDTFARNVTTGDIYLKLLRFLFRKYCMRRSIPFREETFREVLKRVGNLAFECLQTGNYLYTHKKIFNIIGDEAFEYGFLSGHEDFRLLGDATADVFITFPHRLIEEFFGAFHFVFNDDTNTNSVLEPNSLSSRFMINIYFLEFCLFAVDYILTECKTETNVKEEMMMFVLDRVNVSQLDMSSIAQPFPVLSWYLAVLTNNKLVVKFLAELFSKCSKVRLLMLNVDNILHGVVKAVQHLFPHLHCVHLTGIRFLSTDYDAIPLPELCPGSLNLVVSHQHDTVFNTVFSHLTRLQKDISLFIVVTGFQSELDLSIFLRPEISKLHLLSYGPNNCKVISASNNRMYRKLIHLSIKEVFITPNCLLALSNARKSGLLPNLSHILFPNCQYSGTDNIKSLFQPVWSSLTELNLNSCFLSNADNDILSKHRDILPRLTSLELYLGSNIKIEDEDTVPQVCANYMLVESKGDATLSTVFE